jgi:hypothetical protein
LQHLEAFGIDLFAGFANGLKEGATPWIVLKNATSQETIKQYGSLNRAFLSEGTKEARGW